MLTCPSCDCETTPAFTWIDHKFPYGEDTILECKVPLRTCLGCSEKWFDHHAEDIMAEVVRVHLSPVVIDDGWIIEATLAAKRAMLIVSTR